MPETKRDYQVGRGKPPVRTRFEKGQSGTHADRARKKPKNLLALLIKVTSEDTDAQQPNPY